MTRLALLALILSACAPVCASTAGRRYALTFVPAPGGCGDVAPVLWPQGDQLRVTTSGSTCDLEVRDGVCGWDASRLYLHWTADGSEAYGSATLYRGTCVGTYDVHAVELAPGAITWSYIDRGCAHP